MPTKIVWFLILAGAANFAFAGDKWMYAAQNTPRSREIPTVSFCDLVSRPNVYEGIAVRVRVSYLDNFEWALLYDLNCAETENFVWPILKCSTERACKALRGVINRNLRGDPFSGRRVELIIVGRLVSGTKSGHRYGPQNGFRLAFAVEQIEHAIPIEPSTPMPFKK